MANLENTDKQLNSIADGLKNYVQTFGSLSKVVVKELNAMDPKFEETIKKIVALNSSIEALSVHRNFIDLSDTTSVEAFKSNVNQIDKEFNDYRKILDKHANNIVTAYKRMFKIDEHTGDFKLGLNDFVNGIASDENIKAVKESGNIEHANALKAKRDKLNRINYEMGVITQMGVNRSDKDKSLGFKADYSDFPAEALNAVAELELADVDPHFSEEYVKHLKAKVNSYEKHVGKYIKGYVELFNEATEIMQMSTEDKQLFTLLTNSELRQQFSEQYKQSTGQELDMSKITAKELKQFTTSEADNSDASTLMNNLVNSFDTKANEAKTKRQNKQAYEEIKKYIDIENARRYDNGESELAPDEIAKYLKEARNKLTPDSEEYAKVTKSMKKAEEDAITAKFNEAKNYVNKQELITGKKMSLDEQLEHYKSSANTFKDIDENKYIELLKEQRRVEADIEKERLKANDEQLKAKEKALQKELNTVLKYAEEENALRGYKGKSKLTYQEEIDYYNGQLNRKDESGGLLFKDGTDEQIDIIKKLNESKRKLNEERAKSTEDTAKREQDALKQERDNILKYVDEQNLLRERDGKSKLTYQEEINYYNKQLNRKDESGGLLFKEDTNHYLDILDALLNARKRFNEEQSKANEEQLKDKESALKKELELVLSYVEKENITRQLSGKAKLTSADEVKYYSEQLNRKDSNGDLLFKDGTDEQYKIKSKLLNALNRSNKEQVDARNEQDSLAEQIEAAKFKSIMGRANEYKLTTGHDMPLQDQLTHLQKNLRQFEEGSERYRTIQFAMRELDKQIAMQRANDREQELQNEHSRIAESIRLKEEEARKQQEALTKQLNAIKGYVAEQNILRKSQGQSPLTAKEEAQYYESQLSNFEANTKEYIEVTRLKLQAEQRAAEEEKRLFTEAQNRVSSTLGKVKSFANGVNNAVNKVVSGLRSMVRVVTTVFNTVVKTLKSVGTVIKNLTSLFGGLSNKVMGTSKDFNIFKNSATELRSKIQLLKGAFNTLFNNEMVNNAKKLMSSVYSIKTISNTIATDKVIEWAKSYEYAFGLSAGDLIKDMSELNAVMYGLGMSDEHSLQASKSLTIMGQYLAGIGLAGGDATTAMSKLTSGMKGMTASVDDLGVSVRDAEMDSFLKNLKAQGGVYANIATDFSSLNEEARVYVRYASMVEQFTSKYSDFAKKFEDSLNTTTGRINAFKSTISKLKDVIGTGLLNAFAKLTTFLIPLINMLTNAISKLFAFLGLKTELESSMNGGANTNDMNDSLDETKEKLDKVKDSAEKTKGALQSFDRVNNVTSSSSSKDKAEDSFDYSILMGEDMLKELDEAVQKYTKSFTDRLHDEMLSKLREYWDKFNEFAKEATGRVDFDLGFDFKVIKENLSAVFNNIKTVVESWGAFFIDIGLRIADDVNIGKITTTFSTLIEKVSLLASTFSNVAIPVLKDFYENNLRVIFEDYGKIINDTLNGWIDKVKSWTKYWQDTSTASESLTKSLDNMWKIFNGEKDASGVFGNIVGIFRELVGVVKELWPGVKELAVSFGAFAKNELLPWLLDKLQQLREWLAENRDKIVEIVKTVTSIAWDGFKIFVELVGKLVDVCVKHPGVVVGFFAGLLGLKVGTWFLTTAAGLGQMAIGLLGLTSAVSAAGGVIPYLTGLGTSFSTVFTSLGTGLKTIVTGLGAKIAAISGPVLIVTAVIIGVIAVIRDLWKTSETFRDTVTTVWNNVKDAFESAWKKIGDTIGKIKDEFKLLYESYSDSGLKDIIEVLASVIVNVLGTAISTAISLLGSLVSIIGEAFANIVRIINGVFGVISGVVDTIIGLFIGLFTSDWEPIKAGAFKAVQGLCNILMGTGSIVIDLVAGLFVGLYDGFKELWDGFKELCLNFIDNIKALFGVHSPSTVFAEIGMNLIQGLYNGIVNMWNTLVNNVSNLTNNLINIFKNGLSGLFNVGKEMIGNLWNGISTGWNTLTSKVGELVNSNGLISGIGNMVVSISENIKGRTSATTAKKITSHAVGGSIAGGQLFIANENGQPELIGNIDKTNKTNVANNNMIIEAMTDGVFTGVYNALAEVSNQRSSVGGSGQNVNINIDGFGLIDSSTINQLARLLSPYLNSNNRNIANVDFSI